jgi:hypothetical protein
VGRDTHTTFEKETGVRMLARIGLLIAVLAAFLTTATAAGAAQRSEDVRFTAAYPNSQGGYFRCDGVRSFKSGPSGFTRDVETCRISDLSTWPVGRYVIAPNTNPDSTHVYWWSDYDGKIAQSGTVTVSDDGDGTGEMQIVAYY